MQGAGVSARVNDPQAAALGARLERFTGDVDVRAFLVGKRHLDGRRGAGENHFGALDVPGARHAEHAGAMVHGYGFDARIQRERGSDDDPGQGFRGAGV